MKPYYQDEAVTIYHGDCRDILPQLGEVDLVLTDPPYGMGEVFVASGSDRSTHIDNKLIAEWDTSFDVFSIPWPDVGLVVFTVDWRVPEWYKLRPQGRLMAWVKTNPTPSFRRQMVNAAEWLFYDALVNYRTHQNTQTAIFTPNAQDAHIALYGPYETSPTRPHPSQKPLWLMSELLQMFIGEIILDPFMGSGTMLRAAKDLGRKAIGIEIEERYCEMAAMRMAQTVMQFT